mgnify:FL=1
MCLECPYYQNGAVLDLRNKYNEVLVNDGKAPLIRPMCKQELADKEDQKK